MTSRYSDTHDRSFGNGGRTVRDVTGRFGTVIAYTLSPPQQSRTATMSNVIPFPGSSRSDGGNGDGRDSSREPSYYDIALEQMELAMSGRRDSPEFGSAQQWMRRHRSGFGAGLLSAGR